MQGIFLHLVEVQIRPAATCGVAEVARRCLATGMTPTTCSAVMQTTSNHKLTADQRHTARGGFCSCRYQRQPRNATCGVEDADGLAADDSIKACDRIRKATSDAVADTVLVAGAVPQSACDAVAESVVWFGVTKEIADFGIQVVVVGERRVDADVHRPTVDEPAAAVRCPVDRRRQSIDVAIVTPAAVCHIDVIASRAFAVND